METSPKVAQLLDAARELIDAANETYSSVRLPCGSRALAFAVEAGLPPQMTYTIEETSLYTGVSRRDLTIERDAGRLRFMKVHEGSRSFRIAVDDVDRWLEL